MEYRITVEQNGLTLYSDFFTVADDSYREQLCVTLSEANDPVLARKMGIATECPVVDVLVSDGAVSVTTTASPLEPVATIEKQVTPSWCLISQRPMPAFPAIR